MSVRRVAALAVLALLSCLSIEAPAVAARSAAAPAVAAPAVTAPATAGPAAIRVMTFNLCGNVCRHGEVARTTGSLAYQIRSRGVAVALLQEVCYTQFLGLRARLAAHGYTAVFGRGASGRFCDDADRRHGRGFGVAVVARGSLSSPTVIALPRPYGRSQERRVLLTAELTRHGRRLVVATTHTAPGGPNLPVQLAAVRRLLAPVAAVRTVIVGGDLNALPENPGLDGFYATYAEAARARTALLPTFRTTPRHIDYLFARRLTPRAATLVTSPYSDHRMYLGLFA